MPRPINKANPIVVNKTYDIWKIIAIAIMPKIEGNYTLACTFVPVRDTGEILMTRDEEDNEVPVLDENGDPRPKLEELKGQQVRLDIDDLLGLMREKGNNGDRRYINALESVMTLLTETAVEQGLIDVGE